MNRRDFLHSSSAAALAMAGVSMAADAPNGKPPRVGLIGCGWYGMVDLRRLMEVTKVEVVSLCDVDKKHLADAAKTIGGVQGKEPQTFADYRKMLQPKDLDIVLVGTPDHWHALCMIAAVEAGADVYVQKPISVDLREGRAMVDAARKHKRVVQVGTQRRSTSHFKSARDFLQSGSLGRVASVNAFCYWHMRAKDNPEDSKPPENLDYEMWTGPAPMRPYNSLVHPKRWRSFTEYGNGILGDMGVHMLDATRYLLDLQAPKKIFSTGGILMDKKSKANITDTQTVSYDFGDLTVVWEHRTWGRPADPRFTWGIEFIGEKGTLKIDLDKWEYTPVGKEAPEKSDKVKVEDDKEDKNVYPANRDHQRDFLKAIASRGKPVADIEQGHLSTSMCVLGNVSQKLGRSLTWDAEHERVVGDDEANKLLRREYRKPWVHPHAG